MDYIHLNDLEFYGFHGALPEETKLRSNISSDYHFSM